MPHKLLSSSFPLKFLLVCLAMAFPLVSHGADKPCELDLAAPSFRALTKILGSEASSRQQIFAAWAGVRAIAEAHPGSQEFVDWLMSGEAWYRAAYVNDDSTISQQEEIAWDYLTRPENHELALQNLGVLWDLFSIFRKEPDEKTAARWAQVYALGNAAPQAMAEKIAERCVYRKTGGDENTLDDLKAILQRGMRGEDDVGRNVYLRQLRQELDREVDPAQWESFGATPNFDEAELAEHNVGYREDTQQNFEGGMLRSFVICDRSLRWLSARAQVAEHLAPVDKLWDAWRAKFIAPPPPRGMMLSVAADNSVRLQAPDLANRLLSTEIVGKAFVDLAIGNNGPGQRVVFSRVINVPEWLRAETTAKRVRISLSIAVYGDKLLKNANPTTLPKETVPYLSVDVSDPDLIKLPIRKEVKLSEAMGWSSAPLEKPLRERAFVEKLVPRASLYKVFREANFPILDRMSSWGDGELGISLATLTRGELDLLINSLAGYLDRRSLKSSQP